MKFWRKILPELKRKIEKEKGVLYQQVLFEIIHKRAAGRVLDLWYAAGEGQYGVEGSLNNSLRVGTELLQSVTNVRIPLTVGKYAN